MSRLSTEIHPILTSPVIQALHSKQIFSVLDFIKADTQLLIKITRLTFKDILTVRKSLLEFHSPSPKNGYEYYRNFLRNAAIISTGIERVDTLLDGGFFTGNIYEVCGLPASGKTYFALTVLKNAVSNFKQTVHFLDTKNNFVASKMKRMLENECKDEEKLLDSLKRIVVQRINTKNDLLNGIYQIKDDFENGKNSELVVRLVIIDSLPALLLGSADFAENNLFLNHLTNVMRYIATKYHVVFLITNILTTWNEGNFKNLQNATEKIACGKYWWSIPNCRVKIEKTTNTKSYTLSMLNKLNKPVNGVNVELAIADYGFQQLL